MRNLNQLSKKSILVKHGNTKYRRKKNNLILSTNKSEPSLRKASCESSDPNKGDYSPYQLGQDVIDGPAMF